MTLNKQWQNLLTRYMYLDKMVIVEVKVIFAGVKQLKQLQIKPRKKALMGFEPMTSMILVRCSTNWAMKPSWKQVKSEFNLYPLHVYVWREWGDVHLMKIICTLCFISYTHQVGSCCMHFNPSFFLVIQRVFTAAMLEGWNIETVLQENRSYFPEERKIVLFFCPPTWHQWCNMKMLYRGGII